MFDLDLLRLFVKVAELGSIAAAARAEGISPSFASRRITALEQTLNSRLVVRTTRNLMLTNAGQACLAWARDNLNRHDQLIDELSSLEGVPRGVIRVASHIYTGHTYLNDTIREFRTTYPDVHFQITISDRPARLVTEGYDIAIHSGPMPEGNFVGRRIRNYHRFVCASPDYLSRHFAPTTPRDLERLDILNHSLNEPTTWHFRDEQGAVVMQPVRPVLESNSYLLLRDLALKGTGIVRISENMIGAELAHGRLVRLLPRYRCVDPAGDDYAVRLVYPDRHLPFRVQLFAQHLLDRWAGGISPEDEVKHTIPDVPPVVPHAERQSERL
jgi:DNA-binding transcriptional LysR family regulator